MSVNTLAAAARRVVIRATAGALVRRQARLTDHSYDVIEITRLRAENTRTATPEDIKALSDGYFTDPALLHAMADAFSCQAGFAEDGRLTIIDEPHLFSAATAHAFDDNVPDAVSYPEWIRYDHEDLPPIGFPKHPYAMDNDERWQLWARQGSLDLAAACVALKVGRYQTPIAWWKDLGFLSAEVMLRKLARTEIEQLAVLRRFIAVHNLMGPLLAHDWRTVALAYHGPALADATAIRLADAWKKRVRLYQ